jgi:hypothetical protein
LREALSIRFLRIDVSLRIGENIMKHGLMQALGFASAALLALATSTVAAQSNGPYYATPSWDQQLPGTTRFVVLSNWIDANFPAGGAAVLDRETGLVWERSPSVHTHQENPAGAIFICWQAQTGGRMGWRVPRVEEFMSLADQSHSLPAGHPFLNVFYDKVVNPNDIAYYWTADQVPGDPELAMAIRFQIYDPSQPGILLNLFGPTSSLGVWCVRTASGTPFRP